MGSGAFVDDPVEASITRQIGVVKTNLKLRQALLNIHAEIHGCTCENQAFIERELEGIEPQLLRVGHDNHFLNFLFSN